ncbi:MAG: UDP-N-acetylmuramoyl-L-alanine--D-glutamate ligase [bacterium]
MKDIDIQDYWRKRCHIIGIARSGVKTANLLHRLGAQVSISDTAAPEKLAGFLGELERGIQAFPGRQDTGLLAGVEMLIVSPGVPLDSGIIQDAERQAIEVIGEIELAYRVITEISRISGVPVRWYGITGSNGKSTTTTLLGELLKRGKRYTVLAGNIGVPLSGEALSMLESVGRFTGSEPIHIVLELSSFQLETVKEFRADMSALLNITEDHMDRYHAFSEYAGAKARIFDNQDRDTIAVINADDETAMEYAGQCNARKYFVSSGKKVAGIYSLQGDIFINTKGSPRLFGRRSDIRVPGVHNLSNAMTAGLMASLAGISDQDILAVLREFPGLEHRIEFSGEKRGVKFYNDSKGTNIGAVIKSLESFDSGVILIAGGRDKNSDFTQLTPFLKGRVKKVVLIGEAADKIARAIGTVVPVERVGTFSNAVAAAYRSAAPGDTVLLSPACASFDMFRNFEDRGRQFKEIVSELITEETTHA